VRVVHPRPLLQDFRQHLGKAQQCSQVQRSQLSSSDMYNRTFRRVELNARQPGLGLHGAVAYRPGPSLQPSSLECVQQQCLLVCSGSVTCAGRHC
jgi:hypothetical protein